MPTKKMLTLQLDESERKKVHANADKIGISDAAYARNVIMDELKTKRILNRMTGKGE